MCERKCTLPRVCIGGRTSGFTGRMPGVFEEVFYTLNARKPVFLLGGFGGATTHLTKIVRGASTEAFSIDYYKSIAGYSETIALLKTSGLSPPYEDLRSILSEGSERLMNGLSIDDNDLLMQTTRWKQASDLIVKGLSKLAS